MKKLAIFIFVQLSCLALFSSLNAAPVQKKYLVFLVDGGSKGLSPEIIAVLNRYPELRLSVAWPQGVAPGAPVLALIKNKRIEPVLTLADEPVLPPLYRLQITTPAIDVSWQEDAWNIIARNQQEYQTNFQSYAAGLSLRAGNFTRELVPGLKKLGLRWITTDDIEGRNKGAFLLDDFLVLSATTAAAAPQEFVPWISARTEPVLVLRFSDTNPLTPELLATVAETVLKSGKYRMIVPGDLPQELRASLPAIDQWNGFSAGHWTVRPAVWYKMALAHKAIEDYTNSGSANLRLLEMLRNELYQLYNYEFLDSVLSAADPEKDQVFMVGLENIYRLLKSPVPAEIGETVDALPESIAAERVVPNIEAKPDSLTITNASAGGNAALAIEQFKVEVSSDVITYTVKLASGVPGALFYIDVYLDLNNQQNAGFTRLLPGAEAFLKEKDAWEYALRIDRYQAALYRSGRGVPVLVRTFMVNQRFIIQIPRTVLRGNPLRWGYQVIALDRQNNAWTIEDFLSRDPQAKARLLQRTPREFPAIRAQ